MANKAVKTGYICTREGFENVQHASQEATYK